MNHSKLWLFLKGYATIDIIGDSPWKILQSLTLRGISLIDIKAVHGTTLRLTCRAQDRTSVEEILTKKGYEIQIKQKWDFETLLHTLNTHRFHLIGLAFFLAFLIWSSGLIWVIEIEGVPKEDEEAVLETMAQYGLAPMEPRSKIETLPLRNALLKNHDDYIFVGFDIEGTRVHVQVALAKVPPEIEDPTMTGDIIADFDGVIEDITILRGESDVKEGDTVKAGDVLAYGYIQSFYDGSVSSLVRAKVMASMTVTETVDITVSTKDYTMVETGEESTLFRISLADWGILQPEAPYENADITVKTFMMPSFFKFLSITQETHKALEPKQLNESFEEVIQVAVQEQLPENSQLKKIEVIEEVPKTDTIAYRINATYSIPVGTLRPHTEDLKWYYLHQGNEAEKTP